MLYLSILSAALDNCQTLHRFSKVSLTYGATMKKTRLTVFYESFTRFCYAPNLSGAVTEGETDWRRGTE